MARRALVTGGCGFIGSYLVDRLVEAGYECRVVDVMFHGSADNLLRHAGSVAVDAVDIVDRPALDRVFAEFRPSDVYHLAAHHFIPYCNAHPTQAITTNIVGSQNVADACAAHGVQRVFFASTAAVYGISTAPCGENDRVDPADVYGMTKWAGEKIFSFLSRETGARVVIGRYFNAVGRRETNPHILPEIMSQLAQSMGKPVLRLGNISPKRDYIHAADLADASFSLLTSERQTGLDTVNIGSGEEHSVAELIERFSLILGQEIEIVADPARQRKVDRLHLCADITKLRENYGWRPASSLDDAIAELVEEIQLSLDRNQPATAFGDGRPQPSIHAT